MSAITYRFSRHYVIEERELNKQQEVAAGALIGSRFLRHRETERVSLTREESRQVIYRMYEAFNSRDINSIDDIFTNGFYSHPLQAGVEAVKKAWASMFERFPDIRVVVEDLLMDGDKAASRTSIQGINIANSEKQPMIIELIRVENQRIAEVWGLTNLGEFFGEMRKG